MTEIKFTEYSQKEQKGHFNHPLYIAIQYFKCTRMAHHSKMLTLECDFSVPLEIMGVKLREPERQ